MNVLMLFLSALGIILIWVLCGFVGFLIEVKREGYTKFDKKESDEFMACVVLGVIALIVMVCCSVKDWFIKFMDTVLRRINHNK